MSTCEEIAKDTLFNDFHKHFEGADGYANSVRLFQENYKKSGDPSFLLAAFCFHLALVDSERKYINNMAPMPLWILNPLAKGFAAYLDGNATGEKVSFEESIGITKEMQEENRRLTTIDKMAKHVHILRWLFGLNVKDACRASYRKYEYLAKSDKLTPGKVGITQKAESFLQYYQRKYAKNYRKWKKETEARGAVPTEKGRNQILSQMSDDMVSFVRRTMKPII